MQATRQDAIDAREVITRFWHRRRLCGGNYLKVLVRDKGRCRNCGGEVNIEVHHRDRNRRNNNMNNLRMLCKSCHRTIMHCHVKKLMLW